jgi:hypothetical protein
VQSFCIRDNDHHTPLNVKPQFSDTHTHRVIAYCCSMYAYNCLTLPCQDKGVCLDSGAGIVVAALCRSVVYVQLLDCYKCTPVSVLGDSKINFPWLLGRGLRALHLFHSSC